MTTEQKSGGRITLLATVLMLPVVYVLSVGPAVVISSPWPASRQAVEIAYTPVIWLHGHTPLKRPLELYLELWLQIPSAQ